MGNVEIIVDNHRVFVRNPFHLNDVYHRCIINQKEENFLKDDKKNPEEGLLILDIFDFLKVYHQITEKKNRIQENPDSNEIKNVVNDAIEK